MLYNWVSGMADSRAECRIEAKFNDLVKAIEQDIKKFNNLPEEKRSGRIFKAYIDGNRLFIGVKSSTHQPRQTGVFLDLKEDSIKVTLSHSCGEGRPSRVFL